MSKAADKGPRRAGRRPRHQGAAGPAGLTKEAIIRHVIRLAQREPFSKITMVRLGRDLGVAPSLIHYFLGSRDDLLSLIVNHALKEVADRAPPLSGRWRTDLEALSLQVHEMQLRWKAVTTHIASQNDYRLFQRVLVEGSDYGLVLFDRMGTILRNGGFSPSQAALSYHLLMHFLTSVARAHVFGQEPAARRAYIIDCTARFALADYPGANYMLDAFTKIDTRLTFDKGLHLLLDGIACWPRKGGR
ncbi:TetR/AcrR family transcriptional regulator C-terminal domain-containing protein [Bradyrhizobium sp. Arg237L]|uniref:TetR/AcrR family transcriptional regulator n=1 Tax=Bradyrhizobium sp. Arg237L TaxID=3003352 RepID=UPI00249E569C|nr:TetR/AcrR family transcriptional regulator C-terminal domain-containing protein [Bradyrhizobium sp. Arg237L]MDI4234132.1 TetR/AcrR family transcriptional regulator C-terminal domain-containing protein [Bradyrhizobium sp. Arg237L]